mmetsp:Transcript_20509/g.72493  ORF Transcript_20509/g.72493 Transcript_20509/m.72493 type:complete len:261 (+) Transcript_20509:1301-2083(+)
MLVGSCSRIDFWPHLCRLAAAALTVADDTVDNNDTADGSAELPPSVAAWAANAPDVVLALIVGMRDSAVPERECCIGTVGGLSGGVAHRECGAGEPRVLSDPATGADKFGDTRGSSSAMTRRTGSRAPGTTDDDGVSVKVSVPGRIPPTCPNADARERPADSSDSLLPDAERGSSVGDASRECIETDLRGGVDGVPSSAAPPVAVASRSVGRGGLSATGIVADDGGMKPDRLAAAAASGVKPPSASGGLIGPERPISSGV